MSRTLLAEIERFDATLPLASARTIPSKWYRDSGVCTLERSAVFGDAWQLVARTEQLAEPGAFVATTIAGEPIVVVRDEEGLLRAFFNVCRHRAACVVTEASGRLSRLRCRYHGWTYDLRGRLRGAPEFDGVAEFRRDNYGLHAVSVDSWGPLVFVNLGDGKQRLADALAPLPARVGEIARFQFVARKSYELACNWKVFVDNYLDGGYHVNTVHPSLAGVLHYSQYKTECFEFTNLQTSPLRVPEEHAETSASAVRTGTTASYGWVFPNFMINVYSTAMDTNLVLPLGPEKCAVHIDFFVSPGTGADAGSFSQESVQVGHEIQLEDVGVCEDVQRGLASKSFDTGRYSVRREAAVHHFHRLLAGRLRRAAKELAGLPRSAVGGKQIRSQPKSVGLAKSRRSRGPPRT